MIIQKELDILKKHLEASDLSDYNKKKLRQELDSAKVVDEDELPDDVVRIDSLVEIKEEGSGRIYKFQIVFPAEANMKMNRISVFAPIGIALLGYRAGATVEWEMPGGLRAFRILNAVQVQKSALVGDV